MLSQIILQIVLIIISAVLTTAETSAVSINDSKLEKLSASGNGKAVKLQKLTEKPSDFMKSMQTASQFVLISSASFAGINFSDIFTKLILKTGLPENISGNISLILITLIMTYITLVFGKFIPKKIAEKNPETIALKMVGTALFIKRVFFPLAWAVKYTSYGLLVLMGINPDKTENSVTEEEIIMMSDAGAEIGTIDETENRIIKNVFAFDDMTAGQICTHRTDVSVLWNGDDISKWEETIHATRHSKFPVCEESVDKVIGVLNAKDYFRTDKDNPEIIMKKAVKEPYFVHENLKADRLFAQMKKNNKSFAVVVDEYGGMTGIITMTDLVEQLVGEFDENELNEPEVKMEKQNENTWIIPGIIPLTRVCEELEINLPADKYNTFGGYVIAELGAIPKDGMQTAFDSDGLHIEVLKLHHHRIEICRVTKIQNNQSEQ